MVDRCSFLVVVGVVSALWAVGPPLPAQQAVEPAQQPAVSAADRGTGIAVAKSYRDPYQAYAAGEYQQALEKLTELQIARPEDPDLILNVGSAHYQLKDYSAAEEMYQRAARLVDPARRSAALFNLGNTAYRQGRLTDAIDDYMAALDLAPDDEDAKFNLEFVREEIRRRQEQQQQQQQQKQQEQESEDQRNPQDQQDQDGSENDDAAKQQPQSESAGDADQDQDGLPDEVERIGRNPTDPSNRDTDGDGKADGEEDLNRNGQVDPGETDPNVADPGNDDQQAGEENEPTDAADREGGSSAPVGARPLSPEEAARFLQALEEHRPANPKSKTKARSLRVEKDW